VSKKLEQQTVFAVAVFSVLSDKLSFRELVNIDRKPEATLLKDSNLYV